MPEPGQPISAFHDPHIHGQAGTMPGATPAAQGQPSASHAPGNASHAVASQPPASQSQPAAGMPGAPASQTAEQPSPSHAPVGHAPGNGSQPPASHAVASHAPGSQTAEQPPASQADAEDRPITDFARVDLQLGGAEVNRDLLDGFGRAATEAGLTPRQARALAQWHMRGVAEARDAAQAAQARELAASWGRDYEANRQQVVALCSRLDRVPGLENFSSELARSGAADNAVVVRGLRELAAMLGEDRAGAASGSGQRRAETAYEGICDAFARARSGNNHIIQ